MPIYKQRTVLEIARGVKAFLNLDLILTRGRVAGYDPVEGLDNRRSRHKLPERESTSGGVRPENVVWIFGSGRSGSTWLRTMMSEMKDHVVWEEPMVGLLFGGFHDKSQEGQLGSKNYIMGEPTRKGWTQSIRNFTLDGARYAHPEIKDEQYLIIKEPNGSMGAPLLVEALPESRMICLIRDPRDVVASVLDAAKEGAWMFERTGEAGWKSRGLPEKQPEVFVEQRARAYMIQAGGAKRAYESHRGPKVLVKYEDLRSNTFSEMKRVYTTLGMPSEETQLARVVEKHSWENIPQEEKGEGKFYRKGSPGSWREDLTSDQVRVVEKTAAPLLKAFYTE